MFFWWNYPVNDYCIDRLLVDRVTGLAADLPEAISGFVSNPMNQAEASKLPLFTLADYLWNPQSYDRAQSYDAAFRSLYGDLAEDMRLFCDTICAGYINNYTDSLRFQTLVSRFSAGNDAVCAELKALFTALKEAAAAILENDTTGFAAETEPWLKKAELYGEMGELLMTLAEGAETMDDTEFWSLCTRILELREQTDASSAIVSGKVLTPLFADFEALITARRELIPGAGIRRGQPADDALRLRHDTPDKATDGSLQTYFWSSAAPKADGSDSFTLTLNEPTAVRNLYLAMGADETDGDRLTGYTLEYSSDGETWTAFHTAVNGDTLYLQGLDLRRAISVCPTCAGILGCTARVKRSTPPVPRRTWTFTPSRRRFPPHRAAIRRAMRSKTRLLTAATAITGRRARPRRASPLRSIWEKSPTCIR